MPFILLLLLAQFALPAPKPDLRTPEQRRAVIEEATRSSRYRRAEERIRRIVDAWPPLTPEQRERLALILHSGAGNGSG